MNRIRKTEILSLKWVGLDPKTWMTSSGYLTVFRVTSPTSGSCSNAPTLYCVKIYKVTAADRRLGHPGFTASDNNKKVLRAVSGHFDLVIKIFSKCGSQVDISSRIISVSLTAADSKQSHSNSARNY